MSVVREAWTMLDAEARTETGWHLRRIFPSAAFDIFAGIHQPEATPGLILETPVATLPAFRLLPRSPGFVVEATPPGQSPTARGRIVLSLADPAYLEVFPVLCQDVAEVSARESGAAAAMSAFLSRLHVWQSFMAHFSPEGLSRDQVTGLMGELFMLGDYLAPAVGYSQAIGAWDGPLGEANDFSLDQYFLEVKTTTRQAPSVISITNADQLDTARGQIYLAHLKLQKSARGTTLPELVDVLKNRLLEYSPEQISAFNTKLLLAGYIDARRSNYTDRLALIDLAVFSVGSGFPNIARTDLRLGVRDCSYTIELSACQPFAVTLANLFATKATDA